MRAFLSRKADVRLPEKGNSNSNGARPVHVIITKIKWIWTSRLSTKTSLSGSRGVMRALFWELIATFSGGNNLKGPKDFYLKARTRIWPQLSNVCHIRSTAVPRTLHLTFPHAIENSGTRLCTRVFKNCHYLAKIAASERSHYPIRSEAAREAWRRYQEGDESETSLGGMQREQKLRQGHLHVSPSTLVYEDKTF